MKFHQPQNDDDDDEDDNETKIMKWENIFFSVFFLLELSKKKMKIDCASRTC